MTIAEHVVDGIFGLFQSVIGFALLVAFVIWFMPPLFRKLNNLIGGAWGDPEGSLPTFSPRRIWCRHHVSYFGRGRYGLWATWCEYCGRQVDGRGRR